MQREIDNLRNLILIINQEILSFFENIWTDSEYIQFREAVQKEKMSIL